MTVVVLISLIVVISIIIYIRVHRKPIHETRLNVLETRLFFSIVVSYFLVNKLDTFIDFMVIPDMYAL